MCGRFLRQRMVGALVLVITLLPASGLAQSTVFVIRHAERADAGMAVASVDPDLSPEGRQRAESLANLLRDADVRAIFVTKFVRTQQTAAPLAKARAITPVVIDADDTATLLARLKTVNGAALVVGHSNTVPEVLRALGVQTPVTIGDTEFDNLFIVQPGTPARAIRLHFR